MTPEFELGTRFWESQESVQSCDCGASMVYEFQGGTSAGSDMLAWQIWN